MLLNPFATKKKYLWTCNVTMHGPPCMALCAQEHEDDLVRVWVSVTSLSASRLVDFDETVSTKMIRYWSIHWKHKLGKPSPCIWYSSPTMEGLNFSFKPSFVKSINFSAVTCWCDFWDRQIDSHQMAYRDPFIKLKKRKACNLELKGLNTSRSFWMRYRYICIFFCPKNTFSNYMPLELHHQYLLKI